MEVGGTTPHQVALLNLPFEGHNATLFLKMEMAFRYLPNGQAMKPLGQGRVVAHLHVRNAKNMRGPRNSC